MNRGEKTAMIELQNISKTYKVARRNAGGLQALKSLFHRNYTYIKALDQISFSIQDGEMVGYIGPNGAGKSSTIKIMSGILTPDSGTCKIDNLVPWKQRKTHVHNIGVVFGQRSQLWWDVPIIDSFELLRDIYEINPIRYRKNLEELTEMLFLTDILKTPARLLSLGQRMRCEIAASLLHDPKILFLDEPTIGLDAVSKLAVRDFIRHRNQVYHTTVILTTHDMQDIEALTERILLIGHGQILLDGPIETLKEHGSSVRKLHIDCHNLDFKPFPGLVMVDRHSASADFTLDTAISSVSDAINHLNRCAQIDDLSVTAATAEELVVSLYQEFAI